MNDQIFNNLSDMLNKTHNSSSGRSNIDFSTFSDFIHASSQGKNQTNNNSNNDFDFSNIDIETIMKIKNIMSKISYNRTNPRSNLLQALKPYLKDEKKDKLDQYIQFINILSVLESLNNSNGENNG